jgi:hypothetical protein
MSGEKEKQGSIRGNKRSIKKKNKIKKINEKFTINF